MGFLADVDHEDVCDFALKLEEAEEFTSAVSQQVRKIMRL
jgi:hypothetical protein